MFEDDQTRIHHMLDAAQEAVAFVHDRDRSSLASDRILSLALVKSIEIIGEAASRVTAARREEISDVPWAKIIGMRNRLIHAYFDIELDLVWVTVTKDLPPLIEALGRALSRGNT